jgi:hypothetical protein
MDDHNRFTSSGPDLDDADGPRLDDLDDLDDHADQGDRADSDRPPHHNHDPSHGRSSHLAVFAIVISAVVNASVGGGILYASHMGGDGSGGVASMLTQDATATAEDEAFNCHYRRGKERVREEVKAPDRLAAEDAFCGVRHAGVVVPPLLMQSYLTALNNDDDANPIVRSQRESCSCDDEIEIIQEIDLIVPPKLGQTEVEKKLPRIANQREATIRDVVNPDAKPPKAPPPKEPEKKPEKVDRTPPKNPSLDVPDFSDFDQFRPENTDKQIGSTDGSVSGSGVTGQGDPYLQHVKAQLDNNMTIPSTIPSSARKNLRARIRILINDTGYLLKWEWQPGGQSNNEAFDLMIDRTLKDFGIGGQRKFKQPPPEHLNKWIKVTVDGGQLR